MNIKPIKTEADYMNCLKEIETLFDAFPNTPEGDRLDILTTLAEAYEKQHYPIPAPDPVEAIKYYMESRGLTVHDLEAYIGEPVDNVLKRKKPLTLEMIRKLHSYLDIAADILIQPYCLVA